MNIHEKILAIMQDVQYLAKDDQVAFKNTMYRALSEEKVTSIMRAKLVKYGLTVAPIAMTATRSGQISHVDVTYRLTNAENPQEYLDVVSCGDGADTQDKGAGKAMTYAFKYMWLRTFAIPSGEDPDKVSSAELDAKEQEAREKAEKAKQDEIFCADCKNPIQGVKKRDGTAWYPSDLAQYSQQRYGRQLCYGCLKKAQKDDHDSAQGAAMEF